MKVRSNRYRRDCTSGILCAHTTIDGSATTTELHLRRRVLQSEALLRQPTVEEVLRSLGALVVEPLLPSEAHTAEQAQVVEPLLPSEAHTAEQV